MQRLGVHTSRLAQMGYVFVQGRRVLWSTLLPTVLAAPHPRAAPTAATDISLAFPADASPIDLVA
ncbi:hypothetical protein D2V04_10160 [Pelagerythrobacter aerophilus]|uniref:Uncharacterized protein n=1 Tax=Pelagerythrobacter aerophilus TaxID=2306995 RepID=A0A418NHX8_9SPHN|nr:hypothetical protein D2V04_10160 [Pelagerythrobacter aerophilus]